jgi:hypothetical protein
MADGLVADGLASAAGRDAGPQVARPSRIGIDSGWMGADLDGSTARGGSRSFNWNQRRKMLEPAKLQLQRECGRPRCPPGGADLDGSSPRGASSRECGRSRCSLRRASVRLGRPS